MESRSRGQSTRSSAFGAFAGYNSQWDDVVVGLEVSYVHGKFGGTSRATKELVSGSALSDGFFHDVAVDSSAAIVISDLATFRAARGLRVGLLPALHVWRIRARQSRHRTFVTVHDAVSGTITGPFTPLATLNATEPCTIT